ncbi:MAG TPA: hypothetical protein DCG75_09305 [Bacteroidales bacterium]|nr:hypothetical protein [Bacteroidales bacterium]
MKHPIAILTFILLSISLFSQNSIENINKINHIKKDFDFDYFNEVWLKSADVNNNDAYGFARRASEKIEKGFYKEAYRDIEKALEIDSTIALAYMVKGMYHLNTGSDYFAKKYFLKAATLDSLNPMIFYYLGYTAVLELNFPAARNYFLKSMRIDENFYMGNFGIGNSYMSEGNYHRAKKFYKKAISMNSGFFLGYYNLGVIQFELNKMPQALKYFNKTLEINPQFSQAYFMIGLVNIYNNNTNKSFEFWSKAIEVDPDNPYYFISRGILNIIEKNYGEAYSDIIQALILNKTNRYLFSDYADDQFEEKRQKNIDQFILFHLNENSLNDTITSLLKKYLCLSFGNEYGKAEEALKEAYKIDERSSLINFFKANLSEQLRYNLQAFECYNKALELKPVIYAAYLRRGILFYNEQNYNKAIADFTSFIANNDSAIIAFRFRGNSYMKKGEIENAIKDYQNYLSRDSSNFDVLFNKAVCHQSLNECEKAVKFYTSALNIKPKDNETYYLRSECKYVLSDTLGAINDLSNIDENYFRTFPKAHYLRAILKTQLKEYDQAISDFSIFLDSDPKNIEALEKRGKVFYNIGKFENALQDYSNLIKINPELPAAYYIRGMIYVRLKQFSNACSDFKKAFVKGYAVPESAFNICNVDTL